MERAKFAWLDIHQARQYCRVSYSTLYRAVRRGDLTANGSRGKFLFRVDELDRWLESRVVRGRTTPPTVTTLAMVATAILLLLGVGCDVGAKSCHRNHHHADRVALIEEAI